METKAVAKYIRISPQKARLVADVVNNHELFPGPLQDALPDLTVTWKQEPLAHRVTSPTIGAFDLQRPSSHHGPPAR